jgi:hypothetical protein
MLNKQRTESNMKNCLCAPSILAIFLLGMSLSSRVCAQSLERESLTGESVEVQLRQQGLDQAYNFSLGPVALRTDASISASYNDNIGLNKTGRISDFILTPIGTLHGRWQISDLNVLSFDIGVGYQNYVLHSRYNDVILAPDSQAELTFFVADAEIKLHDTFSYEQDPTDIGQLSNQTRLARFQNDAGITASWDLGDLTPALSYDHANLWVTQTSYDYLTNQSDTLAPKLTVKLDESIEAGAELSVSDVRYERHFENDYRTESAGPFVGAKISDFLSLTGQAGGYFAQYDRGAADQDTENVVSFYGSGAINHKINSALTESLTFGREYLPGLTSNFTQRIYARYTDSWQMTKTINLIADIWWENLEDSNGFFREQANRYGTDWTVQDSLSEHATVSLGYQYILKDANPSVLSYYQNQGTLDVEYRF